MVPILYVLSPVSAGRAHGLSKDVASMQTASFDIFLRLYGEGRLRTYGELVRGIC